MGLEFQDGVGVLGKFGTACRGSMLDWRRKCTDTLLARIPMVIVDQHYSNLPYRALIRTETSINYRAAWENEGGDDPNCCPSTANSESELCEFRLPKLQHISIGVEPKCYQDWEEEFCEVYTRFRGCSPFNVSGGTLTLLPETEEVTRAFIDYVVEGLAAAIYKHLITTAWVGVDEKVDQFNGILYYLENGIEPRDETEGGCDYPLKGLTLNWCEYIHGTAACAAGTCAAACDVVLPIDDPNRPVDAPPTNIVTVYAGLSCETTIDITDMDLIDFLQAWWELVVNEWGVNVQSWMLGIPRNQLKCLAEAISCRTVCNSCRDHACLSEMLTRPTESVLAERRNIHATQTIALPDFPEPRINVVQSEALRQFNKMLFIPEVIVDERGQETYWMLWAWRSMRNDSQSLFNSVPRLREEMGLYPSNLADDFQGLLYDGDEYGLTAGELFDEAAWDWLMDRNCNAVRWWNNAKSGMIPQCPHLWLQIEGYCCDKVFTMTCCDNAINTPALWPISACQDNAAPVGYLSSMTFDFDDNNGDLATAGIIVGSSIDYLTAVGTTYRGIVLGYVQGVPSSVTIGFVNDDIDCTTEGGGVGGDIRRAVGVYA